MHQTIIARRGMKNKRKLWRCQKFNRKTGKCCNEYFDSKNMFKRHLWEVHSYEGEE